LPISQIVFHSLDKKKLKAQIRSAKSMGLEVANCNVLDTPKSVASEILADEGITIDQIGDFNHKIQLLGNRLSQDWIELLSKQTKLSIWGSFSIRNSTASTFQYSTLLNRNREVSGVYDDLVRILAIIENVKSDRSSSLIVSNDLYFLDVCSQLGFPIALKWLKTKIVIDRTLGVLAGVAKRTGAVLVLLWLRIITYLVHRKVVHDCSDYRNLWVASTFLPALISTGSAHDERYKDVAGNIQEETGTVLLYAGWISFGENTLNVKELLKKCIEKKSYVVLISNFLSFRQLIDYILPFDFFKALFVFSGKKSDLKQIFHGVPLYSILSREFWNSYLCSGKPNETVYYYSLIENSYFELFKRLRPRFVTTFLEGYNFGRSIIAACRRLDIKVLGWQESVLHPMRLYYRWGNEMLTEGLENKDANAYYLFPDQFCVWSEHTKNILISNGIPTERILNIGAIRYRGFMQKLLNGEPQNLNPNPKKLLLVGTASLSESMAMIDFVYEAFTDTNDFQIIFRPHPQTKHHFLHSHDKSFFRNIIISDNQLNEDMVWPDVVISSWSTMLCEAFLSGKRCVSICTSGWISQPPLSEEKCRYFSNPNELNYWMTHGFKNNGKYESQQDYGLLLLGDPEVNSGIIIDDFLNNKIKN